MKKNSEPKADISARCTGCGACIAKCPLRAIEFYTLEYVKRARASADTCTGCGECIPHCQFNAITLKNP